MTSSQDETKVYEELLEFLRSDRTDLRIAAIDAVLSIRERDSMAKLIQLGVVSSLVKSCSHPDPVGIKALQALAYLSSNSGSFESQCIEDLLDAGALSRLTEICLTSLPSLEKEIDEWRKRINFSMALLANMTRIERGAVEFVGKSLPDEAVREVKIETVPKASMELLLNRFLSDHFIADEELILNGEQFSLENESELDSHHLDPYQHFAAVLMNSTQTEVGRKFLLRLKHHKATPSSSVLESILPQLRSKNSIRRRGIAGTIKNCCLNSESAWWLLNELSLTKHLLYPLAGPEELDIDEKRGLDPDLWLEGPDKTREPDRHTRLYLLESILLLCATGRNSRKTLRLARSYIILKFADMVEEDEEVSDCINDCVQYLRRDEEGTREGSSDDWMVKPSKALPICSSAGTVGKIDYDDVD